MAARVLGGRASVKHSSEHGVLETTQVCATAGSAKDCENGQPAVAELPASTPLLRPLTLLLPQRSKLLGGIFGCRREVDAAHAAGLSLRTSTLSPGWRWSYCQSEGPLAHYHTRAYLINLHHA